MAEMDLGSSIFEFGQTYVALSRIESLDGVYLSSFNPDKIRANPTVVEFYRRILSDIPVVATIAEDCADDADDADDANKENVAPLPAAGGI